MQSHNQAVKAIMKRLKTSSSNHTNTKPEISHVLLFGIDGIGSSYFFPKDTIENNSLTKELLLENACQFPPTLKSLLFNDSQPTHQCHYSFTSRSVYPTDSYPNWTSLLCSADPVTLGVDCNEFRKSRPTIVGSQGTHRYFPNVFGVLKKWGKMKSDNEVRTGMFYTWPTFGEIIRPHGYIDSHANGKTDDETCRLAMRFVKKNLKRNEKSFVMVVMDDVDETGHKHGYGKKFDHAVKDVDAQLTQLIAVYKEMGIWENTMLVICSDHGRSPSGKYHGGYTMEEILTPLFFWSPMENAKEPRIIRQLPLLISDIAPTIVTALLDIGRWDLPVQWRGKVIEDVVRNNYEEQSWDFYKDGNPLDYDFDTEFECIRRRWFQGRGSWVKLGVVFGILLILLFEIIVYAIFTLFIKGV